jgi:hypothetical protein
MSQFAQYQTRCHDIAHLFSSNQTEGTIVTYQICFDDGVAYQGYMGKLDSTTPNNFIKHKPLNTLVALIAKGLTWIR